ncbi:hypothetical protein CCACVL1_12342 [Corchorus capsularis]|uniref:Uncharacterized protein n=1 Tax=Corchorus capsularis TaxID=210143 RepID=A0A1R3IGC4_COCAP|nr:hypothetical protein CCACVL1_12342 [Corchorus capsularis]
MAPILSLEMSTVEVEIVEKNMETSSSSSSSLLSSARLDSTRPVVEPVGTTGCGSTTDLTRAGEFVVGDGV